MASKRKIDSLEEEKAPKQARTDELKVDTGALDAFVTKEWQDSVVPTLSEFISIPNQSPFFDPDWNTNGLQEKAVSLIEQWVKSKDIPGIKIEVLKEADRTPLLFIEIPGTKQDGEETVLLYGHFDKQPPMTDTWNPKLGGPASPVVLDGKLYGRGGADDGYAAFASVTALRALQSQNIPHARCVILIEGCEESGSKDLPFYVDKLADRIGSPGLVVCLDSGCGNYKQFWLTTSLRGGVVGQLKVKLLNEGVHSGDASGIVPSTFRITRELLDRLEDSKTGVVKVPELFADIPQEHLKFAEDTANTLGDELVGMFPFVEGGKPFQCSPKELQLNRTWRPTVSYTGVRGIPDVSAAGNVLRPETILNLSIRLPPSVNCEVAKKAVKDVLEASPPYGAQVEFNAPKAMNGWAVPKLAPWLANAINKSSESYFKNPARYMGEGGSIPFMGMLCKKFPETQFVIAGVLGPQSNAHGPNEFLEINMGTKLTACVAHVLGEHYKNVC